MLVRPAEVPALDVIAVSADLLYFLDKHFLSKLTALNTGSAFLRLTTLKLRAILWGQQCLAGETNIWEHS